MKVIILFSYLGLCNMISFINTFNLELFLNTWNKPLYMALSEWLCEVLSFCDLNQMYGVF